MACALFATAVDSVASAAPQVGAGSNSLTQEAQRPALVLPLPVPGFPVGWCIRATPQAFADAKASGFFKVLQQIGYRGGLSVHASTTSFATDAARAIAFLRTYGHRLAGVG